MTVNHPTRKLQWTIRNYDVLLQRAGAAIAFSQRFREKSIMFRSRMFQIKCVFAIDLQSRGFENLEITTSWLMSIITANCHVLFWFHYRKISLKLSQASDFASTTSHRWPPSSYFTLDDTYFGQRLTLEPFCCFFFNSTLKFYLGCSLVSQATTLFCTPSEKLPVEPIKKPFPYEIICFIKEIFLHRRLYKSF